MRDKHGTLPLMAPQSAFKGYEKPYTKDAPESHSLQQPYGLEYTVWDT